MSIREAVAKAYYEREVVGGCWDDEGAGIKDVYRDITDAVVANFLQAAATIPDKDKRTWHMRPDEATEEMRLLGMEAAPLNYYEDTASSRRRISMDTDEVGPVYRAMCEAAPKFELGE